MFDLSTMKTKRLLAIHGWSGTILGLILYVVIVTGTVAVLANEIGRWSAGGAITEKGLGSGLNAPIVRFTDEVYPDYLDEIAIYQNSGGYFVAFFHTHAKDEKGQLADKGELIEFHPDTHEIISHREGFSADLFGHDPAGALDEFIVDLHVNLHLPHPWGLYATGILGLLMFVASVSGFLIHKHLIKDIFVPPRYSSALLRKRDRHILAGSWSLPFSFLLAFTGAYFSFATSLVLPMVAKSAFGGDQMAMFQTLVGPPPIVDQTVSAPVNLDAIISDSEQRAETPARSVILSHWGRADATALIIHETQLDAVSQPRNLYNLASGEFQREAYLMGAKSSMSSTIAPFLAALHFGNFAGLLSKFIWVALGVAMAYVTLTGLHLWLQRRTGSPLWRKFAAATTIVGYGTNIALAGAALGFFISFTAGSTLFWTPAGFIIAAALSIIAGCMVRGIEQRRQWLHIGLAAMLLMVPTLRVFVHGGFGQSGIDTIVVMLDFFCVFSALWMLISEYIRRRSVRPVMSKPEAFPAE
ncbi:MAG: PepSY-associated TM helix domain-containing protein [Pseudomonadota bacterium]